MSSIMDFDVRSCNSSESPASKEQETDSLNSREEVEELPD